MPKTIEGLQGAGKVPNKAISVKTRDATPKPGMIPTLTRPCLACTRSKVKCDKCSPCGRCVRLGLRCVETAPSRRGVRRTALSSGNAELRLLPGLEDVEGDPNLNGLATAQNDATNGVVVSADHVRMWFLIALWRKSTHLFARATIMACRAKLGMGELLKPFFAAPNSQALYGDALPAGNPLEHLLDDSVDVTILRDGASEL